MTTHDHTHEGPNSKYWFCASSFCISIWPWLCHGRQHHQWFLPCRFAALIFYYVIRFFVRVRRLHSIRFRIGVFVLAHFVPHRICVEYSTLTSSIFFLSLLLVRSSSRQIVSSLLSILVLPRRFCIFWVVGGASFISGRGLKITFVIRSACAQMPPHCHSPNDGCCRRFRYLAFGETQQRHNIQMSETVDARATQNEKRVERIERKNGTR